MKKLRVLVSVSDKTGLIPFMEGLIKLPCGAEIVSTGGTARHIQDAGIPCTLVSEVTGFPEMLDGRVRTLHPNIFAGIIADQKNPEHMTTLGEHLIVPFNMVVVNLYPFGAKPCIENIDVGGSSMIRAAAKNYASQIVVVDPEDYPSVRGCFETEGKLDREERFRLAAKAFAMSAAYDAAISYGFSRHLLRGTHPAQGDKH